MTYFNNVKSYEDLKAQYRTLALTNHPDAGGDTEAMKAINGEYDQLFPVWKHRSAVTTTETAASTRSEFYTQHGWKGERYDRNLSLKEIAAKVREFIKVYFNDCKFSVTTEYASMCQELHIAIMEGPCASYKIREEWTEEERDEARRIAAKLEHMNYSESEIEKQLNKSFLTSRIKEAVESVNAYVESFRFDDCDGMIDYFHVNFYYFGVKVGKWDKEYKVVSKTYNAPKGHSISTEVRPATDTENATQDTPEATEPKAYTVTEDTDTRDSSALWVVKFTERMSREEYQATAATLKTIGGYYSKFKHGFIFRNDPAADLARLYSAASPDAGETQAQTPQEQPKTSGKAATQEKISKQIESLQSKIKALSGDYKTNTWKRMNEQAGREQKKEAYSFDIDLLILLYGITEQRELTLLEQNLLISAFRDEFHGYYNRHKAWTETPEEKRYSAWKAVKYPEESPNCAEWYNKEVPKKQKRLNKAGIYNTAQLHKAIAEYAEIIERAAKPIDRTAQEIRRKESEYKMSQKGDIQFTPASVAAQLVELANIDSNSKVLEPSAGIGGIADEIKKVTDNIDVIEQMSGFRELLQLKGYNLVGYDFLEYKPDMQYDAIIMNPPFSRNQDIEHLQHAYTMLKDGGTLVCVTSPHWSFANDTASINFRNWLDEQNYYTRDLESKTFEMTGVSSKILVINKRAARREQTA